MKKTPLTFEDVREVLPDKPKGLTDEQMQQYENMMARLEMLEKMLAKRLSQDSSKIDDIVKEKEEIEEDYEKLWVVLSGKNPARAYRWVADCNIQKNKGIGYDFTEVSKTLKGDYTIDNFGHIRDRDLVLMDCCKDRYIRRIRHYQKASLEAIDRQKEKYLEKADELKAEATFDSAEESILI